MIILLKFKYFSGGHCFFAKLQGEDPSISGHSIPLLSLGAFILIFAFFAFNGGSQVLFFLLFQFERFLSRQLSVSNRGDSVVIARAVVNTLIGCCMGGFVVLLLNKILPKGKWSIVKLINGCLSGENTGLPPENLTHIKDGIIIFFDEMMLMMTVIVVI